MQVSSTKGQVKRQQTFGPDFPIDDWEVEKAQLVREWRDYKDRTEYLERQIERERSAYEANSASLLRELKLKESILEKRLQETEARSMEQILELQQALDQMDQEHKSELRQLRREKETDMQAEQKKYERRMKSLYERLSDEKNAPLSPPLSVESSVSTPLVERASLAKQKTADTYPSISFQPQSPSGISITTQTTQEETSLSGMTQQYHEKELHQTLTDQEERHAKKIAQLKKNHDAEVESLRDHFMNENRDILMHHEARAQNMKSEYDQTIDEIKDQFENEKRVWIIEQERMMEYLRKDLEDDYEQCLSKKMHEWKNEKEDLQASMSGHSLDAQKHWETRLQSRDKAHQDDIKHLESKIEVLKQRLGNEIDRRHKLQERMAIAQEQQRKHQVSMVLGTIDGIKQRRCMNKLQSHVDKIMADYRVAYRLAGDLLSFTDSRDRLDVDNQDQNACLPLSDLLKNVLHGLAVQCSHTDIDEVNVERSIQ